MTLLLTTVILFFGALLAGFLGSLSGLGGGLIITPLIVLGIGADIHYAIGASLISVIATSIATSCAYVRDGFSNIRLGILMETATTSGALLGVTIGMLLHADILTLLFSLFLLYCALSSLANLSKHDEEIEKDGLATWLELNGCYPTKLPATDQLVCQYNVRRVPLGYVIMFFAGGLSGILGIGSGVLKVIALDRVMGLPFKVSTTTSNFMIGVTAAASAGIYLQMGYIDPVLSMPTAVGVTIGSLIGARLLPWVKTVYLRIVFSILVLFTAIQMLWGMVG